MHDDTTLLVGLDGVVVDRVELDPDGCRVLHLSTVDTPQGRLSSPAFFGPGSYWSYATSWLFNQASWTSCGVRYPSPEWILLEL